ncbi:stage II sporulation protein R [Roseburia intestinalis]
MKFPTIKTKKDSLYITLFFLFSIACIAGLRYEQRLEMQKGIAEKIIRFHVIANSDTKEDQDLKLAVRDAVGIKMSGLLKDAADRSQSEAVIRKNMEDMKQTAEKVITERGYDYDVDICLTDTDFPVKTYGAYTFPAGNYEALEIVIGAGRGHNWWCVMYPNMCFSNTMYEVLDEDARSSLKRVLSEDEYQQVLASRDYQVKFKSFEILKGLYDEK